MIRKFTFLTVLLTLALGFSACGDDNDDDVSVESFGLLTVNGAKWEISNSAPNYTESEFFYMGTSPSGNIHIIVCFEDLTDVEVGEDVTPSSIMLGTENAEYSYVDGDVIVKSISGSEVTLTFNNYVVSYDGVWESLLGDSREPDIKDASTLKIKGTVTFIRNNAH